MFSLLENLSMVSFLLFSHIVQSSEATDRAERPFEKKIRKFFRAEKCLFLETEQMTGVWPFLSVLRFSCRDAII